MRLTSSDYGHPTGWSSILAHYPLAPECFPQQLVQVVCVLVPGVARPTQLKGLEVGMGRGIWEGTVKLAQRQPEGVRVHLDQVPEHASSEKEG